MHNAMKTTTQAVTIAARSGIRESLKYWTEEAKDDALLDTGELRKSIKPLNVIGGSGLNATGTINSNAFHDGFNYAYYWHIIGKMPAHPTTPGTTGEHFTRSAEEHGEEIMELIEKAVIQALKKKGW
jgi:hypothetical protein